MSTTVKTVPKVLRDYFSQTRTTLTFKISTAKTLEMSTLNITYDKDG